MFSKRVLKRLSGNEQSSSTSNNGKAQQQKPNRYKFGDATKYALNRVGGSVQSAKSKQEKHDKKPYHFGDISKSVYNSASTTYQNYQFGDLTKTAYHSITSQYEPFSVKIQKPKCEGMLRKRSPVLLTYREYWCVLDEASKCIYLCKHKENYDSCVEILDLHKFDRVQAIANSTRNSFDLIDTASNTRHRFAAPQAKHRRAWISNIVETFGSKKAEEMKQSLQEMKESLDELEQYEHNETEYDLQCVAYYIVDLEYNRSESGNPQSILRNQNFMIAAIIWSYMHVENKQANVELMQSLSTAQKQTLNHWQQSVAMTRSTVRATGAAVGQGAVTAAGSVVMGAGFGALGGAMLADDTTRKKGKVAGAAVGMVIPLTAIAGAVVAPIVSTPYAVQDGFRREYEQSMESMK